MNDRFKFRAYNKELRKMYEVDTICPYEDNHTKGGEVFLKGIQYNSFYYPEEVEVMQCTGLKDKNGKLIYEGDILQSEEYPFKNEKGYNYAAEVLWDDASATFYYYTFRISNNVVGRSTGNTGELNEYEDWKVLGNIYENKELLESEGQDDRRFIK